MSAQTTATSVTASVTVDASAEQAFTTFTTDIGSWWDPEHHILEGTLERMVFEPRVGGRVYDEGTDGSTCVWARVLAWEPPTRVVFSWDITVAWQIETDHAKTSEVEVRFVPEGPARTRVVLEHRNLGRMGEGWEALRDGIGSDDGWNGELRRFAARVAQLAAAAGA